MYCVCDHEMSVIILGLIDLKVPMYQYYHTIMTQFHKSNRLSVIISTVSCASNSYNFCLNWGEGEGCALMWRAYYKLGCFRGSEWGPIRESRPGTYVWTVYKHTN